MSVGPIPRDEELNLVEVVRLVLANWHKELGALAREWLPSLAGPQHEEIALNVHCDAITVVRRPADVVATLADDDTAARELTRLFHNLELGKDVILELSALSVLRPRLTLPNVGPRALKGALRYEVERVSPIGPNEFYYDYVLGDPVDGNIAVTFRIVRKSEVDAALALCHGAGLAVAGVKFEEDSHAADWRSFPVDRAAYVRSLLRRFSLALLGTLAVLLFVAALAGAYLRQSAMLEAVSDAVADVGVRAARVERLQTTIARMVDDLGLAARQKQSPFVVSTLAELTRILPDGTWVGELTLDGSKVRIQGASATASDLIGLIDRSGMFANARFEAPLVHDAAANVDRFDLSFELKGGRP